MSAERSVEDKDSGGHGDARSDVPSAARSTYPFEWAGARQELRAVMSSCISGTGRLAASLGDSVRLVGRADLRVG